MAKKKTTRKDPAVEIRKLFEEGKLVIGTERVEKLLKQGKLKKVFIASNCKEDTKQSFEAYAKLAKADFEQIELSNEEMGIACKKPFSISAVGVL